MARGWGGEGGGGILEHKRHVVHCFQSARGFDPNKDFISCTKLNNSVQYMRFVLFCATDEDPIGVETSC